MEEFLTEPQKSAYIQMHKGTLERKKADRKKAILLLNRGFGFEEVAELLLMMMQQ